MQIQKPQEHLSPFNPKRHQKSKISLPLPFKGMILSHIYEKYPPIKQIKIQEYLYRWYAHAMETQLKKQACQKILVCQQINNCSAFYRMKVFCDRNKQEKKSCDNESQVAQKSLQNAALQSEKSQRKRFKWANEKEELQTIKQEVVDKEDKTKIRRRYVVDKLADLEKELKKLNIRTLVYSFEELRKRKLLDAMYRMMK